MINIENIKQKLETQLISSQILLSKFKLIDQSSKLTSAYNDPTYVPFYYYLGCECQAKTLVEFGFRLGLLSGAFLLGCKTIKNFLAFQPKDDIYYSDRFGRSNIQKCYKEEFDIYVGLLFDQEFLNKFNQNKWDIIIINDESTYDKHMQYLELAWRGMDIGGFIIMDYVNYHKPSRKAYEDFCKINGRDEIVLETQYGVGLIEK